MSAAQDLDRALHSTLSRIIDEVRQARLDSKTTPVITDVAYTVDRDWSGDDAVHITVTVADPTDGREFWELSELEAISEEIRTRFAQYGVGHFPYVVFQLASESEAIKRGNYFAQD